MIKKAIATLLMSLILIDSAGCYSKAYLFQEDIEEISVGDKFRVIMKNKMVYDIIVIKIDEKELHGTEYTKTQKSTVVIQTQEIEMIEIQKPEAGKTSALKTHSGLYPTNSHYFIKGVRQF
jgi:hypothetical protein